MPGLPRPVPMATGFFGSVVIDAWGKAETAGQRRWLPNLLNTHSRRRERPGLLNGAAIRDAEIATEAAREQNSQREQVFLHLLEPGGVT